MDDKLSQRRIMIRIALNGIRISSLLGQWLHSVKYDLHKGGHSPSGIANRVEPL